MQKFSAKRQSEIVNLVFNFLPGLPPNVILSGTPIVNCTPCVAPGVKLPSVLFGQAIINDTAITVNTMNEEGVITTITIPPYCAVLQPVASGVPKIEYEIEATCGTNSPPLTLSCVGILPIKG